jgi:hypothetical protein
MRDDDDKWLIDDDEWLIDDDKWWEMMIRSDQ